ncbi:hypothetical protein A2960_00580 [Candidatus Gottesmanbacteria bacterium RIFCSPLOWO2_01_FULL_39_12b]|uniref:Uncharacterized protein n=1 Tax=Candidatus Gottesmanbacteria bacterium RIFCSPLOWO2_01_FULL_39_12b TaxID=1798388 RepID=A0A1F6AQ97_9BACT|nr:MAG: hypothetical protein A2960_00580 [Candidatus Gottesmanbacteria bacterium RIFCSPLOWO2_01_FULL_39_12b]
MTKKYLFIFILIVLLGAWLRFYRIREYITFLGDEGRDLIVVKRMLIDHKFTLLGPITSVGSMYMGPIYYYFMAPFLWLWNYDPVGPAVMVAFFSVATLILLYLLCAEFFIFGSIGLIATFLYAISPLPIIYGHSSWNPNIVPFFSLLTIYSLLKVVVKVEKKWLSVIGLSLGVLFQLHYVSFMFIPILLGILILLKFRMTLVNYLSLIFFFLISYSPFLVFEFRHQFVNLGGAWRFILENNRNNIELVTRLGLAWHTITDVFVRIFWRLIVIENAEFTKLFIVLLSVLIIWSWNYFKKRPKSFLTLKVILLWLGIGILSFALYQGSIYDYYFGSLFPAPFILTGVAIFILGRISNFGKYISYLIFIILCFFNLKNSPLRIPPSNLVKNTEIIARFVYDKTEGKPYNFALIAGKNSDHAYRYFLELWGRSPITLEIPQKDSERKSVTDQLLVICEEKVCQPLGHPLWEIAGFGMAEITDEWTVVTAKVFRLIPLKESKES